MYANMCSRFDAGAEDMAEHESGVGPSNSQQLCETVVNWMHVEADLLDDRHEKELLEIMVSRDVVHQVPSRVTVERVRGMGLVKSSHHLDERYGSLASKAARTETGFAWEEDPPSKCRHFVTDVRIGEAFGDEVKVRSNLLLFLTRAGVTTPQLISGSTRTSSNTKAAA
jgi:ethylbenzene dioxygenase beta subunit